MLFVLVPLPNKYLPAVGCLGSFSIPHIVLPLTLVSVLLSREYLAEPMSFVCLPLTNIELFVVIVTVAVAFTQILLPITVVFVICFLLFVCAVKNALAVSDISSLSQDLAFVVVPVAVCVLWHYAEFVLTTPHSYSLTWRAHRLVVPARTTVSCVQHIALVIKLLFRILFLVRFLNGSLA